MKIGMSAELEDLHFGFNQIIDLKFLTNDKLQQVINNICDITGNKKNNSGLTYEFGGFIHLSKSLVVAIQFKRTNRIGKPTSGHGMTKDDLHLSVEPYRIVKEL
jgi:hypothetical protein